MAFTNEQMERYSRHIILQEVGVKGQKTAKSSLSGPADLVLRQQCIWQQPVLEPLVLSMRMR